MKDSWTQLLRPTIKTLLSLMQDVLGRTTCYYFQDFPEERDGGGLNGGQQGLRSPDGAG